MEEEKQDYRTHLIATIDNLIDSGVSVYQLNVVNKEAIRHNYIMKSKVREIRDKAAHKCCYGLASVLDDLTKLLGDDM